MDVRRRAAVLRQPSAGLLILAGGLWSPSAIGQPETNRPLTLEEAVSRTYLHSPVIRVAEARVREARGRLTGAQTYPYNPVLEGGAASRRGGGESTVDFDVSIGQEIEIGGQSGDRTDVARSNLTAQEASLVRAKRMAAARVHFAFVAALVARELLEVSRQDMGLTGRLHSLATRRLERGAGTQLDVNVAAAELGRAEARFQAAEAAYADARAALAEAMGGPPSALPLPKGELHTTLDPVPPLDQLVASASAHRADLRALGDLEMASRASNALARAQAWPNLTLSAFGGHEEGDMIIGGALSIPIPVFDRNQGRIEQTRAGIDRAKAAREAGELSAARQVVSAHARYRAARQGARRLRELVLGTLEQNMEFLRRSFDAGKATWPEVVVIRRSLVDAQRQLKTAEAEARRAWIELQIAAGRMPVPETAHPQEER